MEITEDEIEKKFNKVYKDLGELDFKIGELDKKVNSNQDSLNQPVDQDLVIKVERLEKKVGNMVFSLNGVKDDISALNQHCKEVYSKYDNWINQAIIPNRQFPDVKDLNEKYSKLSDKVNSLQSKIESRPAVQHYETPFWKTVSFWVGVGACVVSLISFILACAL